MEINYEMYCQEISDKVMRAKSKSSNGYDIPYNVLKLSVVNETLRHLFQHNYDTGTFPSVWQKAMVCSNLKKPTSVNGLKKDCKKHNNSILLVAFIHLQKYFDFLDRNIIVYKLSINNIEMYYYINKIMCMK